MLEKLFKVNVHLEHMMIVEEINSVEFTVVKPDKLSDLSVIKFTNILVTNKILFKSAKNHLFIIKIDNIRCNKSIILIHIMI